MQRRIYLLILLLSVDGLAAEPTLKLDQLIEEALNNNPTLRALSHESEAAGADVARAGVLKDPMLKLELSNVPLSEVGFDSTPMSGKQLMLSQHLPFWGKRAAKTRMAEHSREAAQAAYRDRAAMVVNLVKQSYFDLAFLDRAIAVTERNRLLLTDFVRIAQTKYSVGTGLQQDVLKAQVSHSELRDKLIVLRNKRRRVEALLNVALNRMPQSPVGRPAEVEQTPFALSVEGLQEMALMERARLRRLAALTRKWQAAEDVARLSHRPDFNANLGYRQRDFDSDPVKGSDFVTMGITLNLPIHRGSNQDQQVQQALSMRNASEAWYAAAKQQIFLEIQQNHIDVQTHREQASLYGSSIIPQAEQALAAALAAYQVDKVEFITLLNSQVTLLNLEIKLYHHLTEGEKSLAKLEAVVGKRLN